MDHSRRVDGRRVVYDGTRIRGAGNIHATAGDLLLDEEPGGIFGENVFGTAVMQKVLPKAVYKSVVATIDQNQPLDPNIADAVAIAMKDWAMSKGATHYAHVSDTAKPDPSAERLAGVLKDPRGLEFTLGFVDGVMRPEDLRVAGKNLERVARKSRGSCPGICDSPSPSAAGSRPCCRGRSSRSRAGCCARWSATSSSTRRPKRLGKTLAKLRADGSAPQHQPPRRGGARRARGQPPAAGTRELLARDDVDYVSIKVSGSRASSRCGASTRPSSGSSTG